MSIVHLPGVRPRPQDPHWDDVVLLLHFEGGVNNVPGPYTDSSKYNRATTVAGTFDYETDNPPKFGTMCVYVGGDSDRLEVTSTGADFTIGTKDFTIETWFKKNDSRTHCLYEGRGSGSTDAATTFYVNSSNFLMANQANVTILTGTTPLVHQQWHHCAWSRRAGVSRIFLDGIKQGEVADTFNYSFVPPANRPKIGNSESGGSSTYGWLDEYRVTIGTGRYVENFPVQTAQFPDGY